MQVMSCGLVQRRPYREKTVVDNHHVSISGSSASCALLELSGISSDPVKVMYALATHLYHPSRGTPASFVMWSDVVKPIADRADIFSNGGLLWRYINNHFGGILGTNVVENPKTSNPIQVWIWTIPHEGFKEWYLKERVERAKRL
jgi:hypothetical protein